MSGDYETHDDRQPDISYIKEKTMSCNLRELTITSLLEQAQGEISKAKTNVEPIYIYKRTHTHNNFIDKKKLSQKWCIQNTKRRKQTYIHIYIQNNTKHTNNYKHTNK